MQVTLNAGMIFSNDSRLGNFDCPFTVNPFPINEVPMTRESEIVPGVATLASEQAFAMHGTLPCCLNFPADRTAILPS